MKRFAYKAGLAIIACAIFLNLFVGCNDSKDLEKDLMGDTTTQNIQRGNLKPVVLTFLIPDTKRKDAEQVLEKVAKESKLNIKLDFQWLGLYFFEKMTTAYAAGVKYDAFYIGQKEPDPNFPFNFVNMARQGELKDLTELLPKYAPSIFNQLSKEELEGIKVDGKIIAVPSLNPRASWVSALVRKDLMEKYKLGPIKTFLDYEKYLQTIKKNETDIIPGAISWPDLNLFAGAFGYVNLDNQQNLVYKWDDPEMKVIPWERTPEFREAAALIGGWQEKGYMSGKDGSRDGARASYLSQIPYVTEGPVKFDLLGGAESVNSDNFYYYILNDSQKIQRSNTIGNLSDKGAIAINEKSPNAERVLMFLDLLQSDRKLHDLFMYGIEGKQYTRMKDRVKIVNDQGNSGEQYAWWLSSPFMNLKFDRLLANDSISDYLGYRAYADEDLPGSYKSDYMKFIATRTSFSPHEGFYPDYKGLESETLARYSIFAESVWQSMFWGTLDAGGIENLQGQLKSAGTDKIVAEVQRQLDQWRKEHKK